MSILRPLALAAAVAMSGSLPACEKTTEQPQLPQEQPVASACEYFRIAIGCEYFRIAIGAELAVEQMASDPAAWKIFPPEVAEAAWRDVHAEVMAASKKLRGEDQAACLRKIREGKDW